MSFTIFQNEKTPFWGIKTRSSPSRKIYICTKGLTYSLGPKMAIFPTFIFQAIQARKMSFTILYNEKTPLQARKMSFTIFQNEKTAFQGIKSRSSKCRKIDIFSKGLTHGFGLKMAFFPTFFPQAIQARKMSSTIFQNEKTSYYAIKTRSLKSRKLDIFPKGLTHVFIPKMLIFPSFFFFSGKRGQQNVFYHILERKDAFLDYKKKNFEKTKH